MKLKDLIPDALLSTEPDAISMLKEDHDKVKDLFDRFADIKDGGADKEKERIVAEACRELTVHTMLEEEVFYPAVWAGVKDDDLMNEAMVEHKAAKTLIKELEGMRGSDEMLNAKFHVLSEQVKHHIEEEQSEMFPKVRDTEIDLVALGEKMMARKQELLAGSKKSPKRASTGKRKSRAKSAETASPKHQ